MSFPGYAFNSWSVYFDKQCITFFLENKNNNSFYTLKRHFDKDYDFIKLKDLILSTDKNYLIFSCTRECT